MSSSSPIDYDALEATADIEEMTENEFNQCTLQSLKNDKLPDLWLSPEWNEHGDYVLEGSTEELGWLGHFVKKSTRLERFGLYGSEVFKECSKQSVDLFLDDLGECNHIKKMNFSYTILEGIIYKLGPAMKNNNIIHLVVERCCLGVPEANFLFNTLRDMISLEELYINCGLGDGHGLNDGGMAGSIPSLATCTGIRKLTLNGLNLSTNSCAALSGVFPRILSDDGLDALIQGLPTSAATLHLGGNEVTLARQLPLLRFKELGLWGNTLCLDGPRVIAASLANPQCHLESLNLVRCNIGNEGAATLAEGLRNNQKLTLMLLDENGITEEGWNAYLPIMCNPASINATHGSNHTLQDLGYRYMVRQDIQTMLDLNSDQNKSRVAATKILQTHRHLDMRPLLDGRLILMPHVVAWLDRFAECRLDLKLSSLYEFARAMPMEVVEELSGMKKGKKRRRSSA
ncbi:hypothetical protein THAOC_01099 [Thalassiosira oceanica]|uniref:Uncharacterized protein n=1 Tax=Thalassiosira oceanica TaxID=159749 RepID=K0TR32_THAOC|nr:hypothetical protein THAOC_01099 [Thalassiosira oceanica]|eukprot:EJK77092.1 hypothetical protein THAOC_01099 [Thalassiosira oceanica]